MKDPIIASGLLEEPIDVAAWVAKIRRADCGGLVAFEGTTRSPDEGREVVRLWYEAYPERAERQLREICEQVAAEHDLGGALAVHRTGDVPPGAPSVLVAASAAHRAEAFAAARLLIDRVKAEAAIWKKEVFADGEAWVNLPEESA